MQAIIVMGVSGCGKTTIAEALSEELGWTMIEGDTLHPQANIDKMHAGIPLDDDDRAPWLDLVHRAITAAFTAGDNVVITCSALKRVYRRRIIGELNPAHITFVHLSAPRSLLQERVNARHHKFMQASLLQSQLDTLQPLEADENGIVVDVSGSPQDAVHDIMTRQNLAPPRS